MPENPYQPPKEVGGRLGERAFGRVVPYVVVGPLAVAATSLAFVVAGQSGFSHWPWESSPANLRFYLEHGVPCGILGAALSALACASATTHKWLVAIGVLIGAVT